MSDSWVRDRMQAGDFPRPGQTAEEYVEAFLSFRLKGRERSGEALDLTDERARLAREQADAKAMDNAVRRGELASLPDINAAMTGVITLARGRLQQLGAQIAGGDLALRKKIEEAVDDALGELSAARVEEIASDDADEGAGTEADLED